MPKITVHGGATNADEPGYFEAIDAKVSAVDGVPGSSVSGYGLASMSGGRSALVEYQRKLAELNSERVAE